MIDWEKPIEYYINNEWIPAFYLGSDKYNDQLPRCIAFYCWNEGVIEWVRENGYLHGEKVIRNKVEG